MLRMGLLRYVWDISMQSEWTNQKRHKLSVFQILLHKVV